MAHLKKKGWVERLKHFLIGSENAHSAKLSTHALVMTLVCSANEILLMQRDCPSQIGLIQVDIKPQIGVSTLRHQKPRLGKPGGVFIFRCTVSRLKVLNLSWARLHHAAHAAHSGASTHRGWFFLFGSIGNETLSGQNHRGNWSSIF